MHFYGQAERYRLAPTAPYPPPLATASMYRREIFERLGIERVVAVQPGAYGADNSCMLDAMAELGAAARGIAVVTPATSEAELIELDRRGVRGARFFIMRNPVVTWEMLEPVAARIAPLGWHIQLQVDGRELPERAERLSRLPCPLVIDHNGKFVEPVTPGDPALSALLSMLESGRVWVKASAAYETSKAGPPRYEDVGTIAKVLIKAAPHRVVWASNWPHGGFTAHKPDDAGLLDLLLDWAPDDTVRKRILVDNPAELYAF